MKYCVSYFTSSTMRWLFWIKLVISLKLHGIIKTSKIYPKIYIYCANLIICANNLIKDNDVMIFLERERGGGGGGGYWKPWNASFWACFPPGMHHIL